MNLNRIMKEEGKILQAWAQHSQLLPLWRGRKEGEPAPSCCLEGWEGSRAVP